MTENRMTDENRMKLDDRKNHWLMEACLQDDRDRHFS